MKYYSVWSGDGSYWEHFTSRKKADKFVDQLSKENHSVVLDLWEGTKDRDGSFDGDYVTTLKTTSPDPR